MKKKLLLIILMGFCLCITGCGSEKKESIKITDSTLKLTTTFKYNEEDGFKFVKKVNGGRFSEIEFSNEKKNLYFDLYYTEYTEETSKANKEHVMYDTYFKEYFYNDCSAYSYGLDKNRLFVIINLKHDDNKSINLFVMITRIKEDKESVVFDTFNEDVIQDFFKSLIITED